MLTDKQIDAVIIREFDENDPNFSFTTPELFKFVKDNYPLIYKVLKVNDLLDETKTELAISDLISSIYSCLVGEQDYFSMIDFSIFDNNEIDSLITKTKQILKNLKDNQHTVAYSAKNDFKELMKRTENHIKYLEHLIAKNNQKSN